MILKTNSEDLIEAGIFNSIQMGVDLSDPSKIMYLLSEGLYPRPRHSIITEYCSNSIDAIIESGKDPLEYPAIVGLDNNKIWFKDCGYGVSLERMNQVISKFGASTKDKDSRYLGCMGLGIV